MADNQEYVLNGGSEKRIINGEAEDDSVYTSLVSSVETNQTKISFSIGPLNGTILRLMSSLAGAEFLKNQAMMTGTQSQQSSSTVGTYSVPTLGASGLSGASNDASIAANDAPHLVFEKMDTLLQEMTNKLVSLDKIPGQLHVLYRAVQDEVTAGVANWLEVRTGLPRTRGQAAVRIYSKIYHKAFAYEEERLEMGKAASVNNTDLFQAYSILINVVRCTSKRISRLRNNLQRGKVRPHECTCSELPGAPRHAQLPNEVITLTEAAQGQIQCVEAYRQLYQSLLGEETWL
ncbi:hypothetical protein FFLO_06559 [Filobasidium floriforme]|uniref:Uncharacterized protein n=1 Tax=Filobasidium floriforme TaxID=5210 RepID=A0A8K0JEM4_9TREE|nr:hypothetical protein FFLO_06559 [Filobasidium floriforme]